MTERSGTPSFADVFTTNPVRAYDATTLTRLTDTGWNGGNDQAQNESVVSHGKLWQVSQFAWERLPR